MNRKLITALVLGAVLSGASYYIWCSLQWRDAAQAKRSQAEGEVSAAAATPDTDPAQSEVPGAEAVESPVLEPPPVPTTSVMQSGLVSLEARFSNAAVLRGGQAQGHIFLTASSHAEAAAQVPRSSVETHLVLVLDRSGSMKGERITQAKSAAKFLIDELAEGDRIAVVSYSDTARVEVSHQAVTASNRDAIKNAIDAIKLRGDTCISCGIEAARNQLALGASSLNAVEKRVILLSDGKATAGMRSVSQLSNQARMLERSGIVVTTVGVGLDYNEQIMSNVAIAGNGNHYFVEDPSTLAFTLQKELDSLSKLIATRAVATFRLAPGVRFVQGFDREFQQVGDTVVVSLGSITAGSKLTTLFEVNVPTHLAGIQPISDVALSYHNLATGNPELLSGSLETEVTDDFQMVTASRDVDVEMRLEQAHLNIALAQANQQIAVGDLSGARSTIKRQKKKSRKRRKNWSKKNEKLDRQLDAFDAFEAEVSKPAAAAQPARASKMGAAVMRDASF